MPSTNHAFTYSARIAPDPTLVRIAECCSAVERRLHAHLHGGSLDQALKHQVMRDSGLPGRYYNGITTVLEGKIDTVRASRALDGNGAAERVKRNGKKIEALQQKLAELAALPQPRDEKLARQIHSKRRDIHGKKRKLASTEQRMEELRDDLARNVPSLCFASKRLFRQQENGRRDHAEWRAESLAARAGQFMLPGSHEEVSGNKTCTAKGRQHAFVTLVNSRRTANENYAGLAQDAAPGSDTAALDSNPTGQATGQPSRAARAGERDSLLGPRHPAVSTGRNSLPNSLRPDIAIWRMPFASLRLYIGVPRRSLPARNS